MNFLALNVPFFWLYRKERRKKNEEILHPTFVLCLPLPQVEGKHPRHPHAGSETSLLFNSSA